MTTDLIQIVAWYYPNQVPEAKSKWKDFDLLTTDDKKADELLAKMVLTLKLG